MTPNTYAILSRCVDEGVLIGIRRAHKHLEPGVPPDPDLLAKEVHDAIMGQVVEVFTFPSVEE